MILEFLLLHIFGTVLHLNSWIYWIRGSSLGVRARLRVKSFPVIFLIYKPSRIVLRIESVTCAKLLAPRLFWAARIKHLTFLVLIVFSSTSHAGCLSLAPPSAQPSFQNWRPVNFFVLWSRRSSNLSQLAGSGDRQISGMWNSFHETIVRSWGACPSLLDGRVLGVCRKTYSAHLKASSQASCHSTSDLVPFKTLGRISLADFTSGH